MEKVKDSEVLLKGFLWVNLPVLVIIFGCGFVLSNITDFSFNRCLLIGTGLGWIYWEIAVVKWIKWALENNVDKDRLYKLGQRSFLLWNKNKIEKAAVNSDKTI